MRRFLPLICLISTAMLLPILALCSRPGAPLSDDAMASIRGRDSTVKGTHGYSCDDVNAAGESKNEVSERTCNDTANPPPDGQWKCISCLDYKTNNIGYYQDDEGSSKIVYSNVYNCAGADKWRGDCIANSVGWGTCENMERVGQCAGTFNRYVNQPYVVPQPPLPPGT